MAEEIKQRISIENAEVVEAHLKRIAELESQLAKATAQTGDAAQTATPKVERQAEAQNKLERETRQTAEAQKKAGQETLTTASASDKAEKSTTALGNAKRFLLGGITSLVTGMVGAAGLSAALRIIQADMDKTIAKSREMAEVELNLQFLANGFDPGEREFVGQAAAKAGRSPVEVTRAYADLKSRFPGQSNEQLHSLMMQVAETAQTTDAPLSSLGNLFATIYQQENDPNKAQNILRETAIQAGTGDPSVLAPLLARFMGIGQSTGLTPSQSAGAVAGATGLGLTPEVATTGLTNVALALQGKGTPGGAEILKKLGIQQGGNFFDALSSVSQAGLNTSQLETIFGREGLPVATKLSDPKMLADFMSKVRKVEAAGNSSEDLTANAIAAMFAADPLLATNQKIKSTEAQIDTQINQDPEALKLQLLINQQELSMRQQGEGALRRGTSYSALWLAATLGLSNEYIQNFMDEGKGDFITGLLPRNASRIDWKGISRGESTINIGQQFNMGTDGESPLTRPNEGGL